MCTKIADDVKKQKSKKDESEYAKKALLAEPE